jgi:monoamine oxidase
MNTLVRAMARVRTERTDVAAARAGAVDDATPGLSRRAFLRDGAAIAAAAAMPALLRPRTSEAASVPAARGRVSDARVVVVGGGLAGLAAMRALDRAGVHATLFESSPRVGGRCWSERRAFGDQVAERGGEFIDTGHETIRRLATDLGLTLDDVLQDEVKGTTPLWWFDGAPYTLDAATADLRGLLPALDRDASAIADALPTWRRATPAQRALDRLSAATWIDTRVPGGARSRLGRLLANAYTEELGADPVDISAVSVVALLQATPRDALSPYAESDQRFHVRGGNDRIVEALAAPLAQRIETGTRLALLAVDGSGRPHLAFTRDAATRFVVADRVILALPFTLLREVDLRRAGFGARKRQAIDTLGMGRNTKLQLQFAERFWRARGGNGETRLAGSYVTSWEVTRGQPGKRGILNFFSGGTLAARAGDGTPESQARAALADLEHLYPGSAAQWTGAVIRNAWDRHPWTRGSYSLLKPGQYTAFHGSEWEPEGPVHFAGEHTSEAASGYLDGAVESGQRAAREVLGSLRLRRRAA